jgi:hypothetical protein
MLSAPIATAAPEELADWLELKALASADLNSSMTDLSRELQRNGTVEEADGDSEDDDADCDNDLDEKTSSRALAVAEAAFALIEERQRSCSVDGAYPFDVEGRSIQLRDGADESAYVFMLLLSNYGHARNAPKAGAKLFEHLCALAAKNFFGAACSTLVFGFPRDGAIPRDFARAVDHLCSQLGEGGKCRRMKKVPKMKDGGLDVVAWRAFPDHRAGKSIAFGQCATGQDWRGKATELLPQAWCANWLDEQPVALPMRLFFIPHRIEDVDWEQVGRNAGIVFDRCRLAYCLASGGVDASLRANWTKWAKAVHQMLRGKDAK